MPKGVLSFAALGIAVVLAGCAAQRRPAPPPATVAPKQAAPKQATPQPPVPQQAPQPPLAPTPSPLTPVSWDSAGNIKDDLDFQGLAAACRASGGYYQKVPPETPFLFGRQAVTASQMAQALAELALVAEDKSKADDEKAAWIKGHFLLYRSDGDDGAGHVLFTGYFEPVLRASRKPDERFRYPLYKRPQDLLEIDLSSFPVKADRQKLYGRIEQGRVLPYYTREDIDSKGVLNGKGLELCFLNDPVDRFFLQVQGSGRLVLEDNSTVRILYDGKNGHPYKSLGKFLVASGKLPKDGVSLDAIRRFLAEHPAELDADLNVNPSYTFFRFGDGGPYGNIQVALTPNRSIATDAAIFPKGAPVLIVTEKPRFDEKGNVEGYDPFARFVLNQDTGGAITGAGRVDIFFGPGTEAGLYAGQMQQDGRLYFLCPKEANGSAAR